MKGTRVTTTRHGRGRTFLAAGAALLLLAGCGSDGAEESDGQTGAVTDEAEEALYEGETIEFVVPYDPGGGYDTNARAVAPYLEECLGATVVVSNEAGAAGLRATTTTATADPESNRIQIVNTVGLVAAQIAGVEGAQNFDLGEFTWLGRISAPPSVLMVNPEGGFDSLQDVLDASEPVRFVAQGPGSGDYINTNLLQAAYGFPVDLITGFAGAPEARTAVVAGDADAFLSPVDTNLGAIQSGDVEPLVTVAEEPSPLLPDVPTVYDTPPADEQGQEILDNFVDLLATGRAVVAPPGLDDAHTAALREGLACALENDELIAQFESQEMPLEPLGGEEMADLVGGLLDAPESFQTAVTESF